MLPMTRRPGLAVLLAFSLLSAACGGGTDPSGGGGGGGSGFSATIDGQAWTADQLTLQVTSSAASPGYLVISGIKLNGTDYVGLSLVVGFIDGPGDYPLGVNQGTTPGGTGTVLVKSGATIDTWITDFTGASGTFTVTSRTGSQITGTFEFTAPPQIGGGASGIKTVTNGSFDLTLPATFTPPTADDHGNTISATLNGQPWNGATVLGVGDPGAGVFSWGGTTSGISINLVTATAVSAGNTYDQTGVTIQASGSGANCCWGGLGTVASLTITSLTATRVTGTFSATLPVIGGGSATDPLVITDGVFDTKIFAP